MGRVGSSKGFDTVGYAAPAKARIAVTDFNGHLAGIVERQPRFVPAPICRGPFEPFPDAVVITEVIAKFPGERGCNSIFRNLRVFLFATPAASFLFPRGVTLLGRPTKRGKFRGEGLGAAVGFHILAHRPHLIPRTGSI